MNPLLNGMNDRQAEAVQTTEGPLLIMAGAGSGKTRVLTHRIAYLIDEKMVNPWNILAITFTNKAAREMKERAYQLNPATQDCLIATFHSMCVRILRRDADHIGYNRNFTIVDPGEQRTLMKRILKSLNLDPKKWNERTILGTISNAKNDLIDEVAYAFHPVHGSGAVMNFTDFVVYTGVEQNTFGSSGFTGVDVRTDTDVTVACDGCCTSHLIPRLFL